MGVLAYRPLSKNRKIGFGHATAQNGAHISTVSHFTLLEIQVENIFVYHFNVWSEIEKKLKNIFSKIEELLSFLNRVKCFF